MANRLSQDTRGRLTFLLALSAFLMGLFLLWPRIVAFYDFGTWSTSDWLMFLQLLVFVASAGIAYTTISSSRTTARERATLDIILNDNQDTSLYEAKNRIFDFNKSPQHVFDVLGEKGFDSAIRSKRNTLTQLFEVEHSELTENEAKVKKDLITVLNRHEFYAVGINSKLLDEELFKRMHCANIIKLWEAVSPAVTQFRTNTKKDTFFKDLELLALRWKSNPLRSDDLLK